MILSRNRFFLLLFIVFIGPFIIYRMIWFANSKPTNGVIWFTGHTLELQGNISSHSVIRFKVGNDSPDFNPEVDLKLKPGTIVPIRYLKNDPTNAKVNSFGYIWLDGFAFFFFPSLVLLILFITPDRFDPLIPRGSKIVLGKKPFIRIIHPNV